MRRVLEVLWECRYPLVLAALFLLYVNALVEVRRANAAYEATAWEAIP